MKHQVNQWNKIVRLLIICIGVGLHTSYGFQQWSARTKLVLTSTGKVKHYLSFTVVLLGLLGLPDNYFRNYCNLFG